VTVELTNLEALVLEKRKHQPEYDFVSYLDPLPPKSRWEFQDKKRSIFLSRSTALLRNSFCWKVLKNIRLSRCSALLLFSVC